VRWSLEGHGNVRLFGSAEQTLSAFAVYGLGKFWTYCEVSDLTLVRQARPEGVFACYL
jgi:hypothetical protein